MKLLIKKIADKVRTIFAKERDCDSVQAEASQEAERKAYAQRVVDNYENRTFRSGVVSLTPEDADDFQKSRSAATDAAQEKEDIEERDSVLRSFFSTLSAEINAITDSILEASSTLPRLIFDSIRKNLYHILEESGEKKIIKPLIDPDKFTGKYFGEDQDYTPLFSEAELGFLSLSLYKKTIDIKERAASLMWFYDKDANIENNMYLAQLWGCDPHRAIDLRSVYYDLFNETWDTAMRKAQKKSVEYLASASDRFFEECSFRRKMERIYGEDWFKEAYGIEYFT